MQAMAPEVTEKVAIQSNLPSEFTFCNPEIGFAHGSMRCSLYEYTDLLHYTEKDESFQTVYLLCAADLFSTNSPLQLHFFSVRRRLEEDWYFVDGAVLSIDGTRATHFLLDKPIYDRVPQAIEEMNITVQRMLPRMLRRSGVSSIQPLLRLLKYTWLVEI